MSVNVSACQPQAVVVCQREEQTFPLKEAGMITIKANTLDRGVPSWEAVRRCVREFEAGLPRLARLARYYEGRHDILARTRLPGLPNVRISHAFPRYIAQVSAAYLLGEPVRLEGPEPAAASLRDLLNHAGADSIDMELALQQAVFGRAVSLCYEDAAGHAFICSLDPRSAFVVYDDSVAHDPLFGVYLTAQDSFIVYTADYIVTWSKSSARPSLQPHPFRALPMVEYRNGTDEHGDFEDVLSLVDAYDLLQADRMNDRQQFSDALLVLKGVMGITADADDNLTALERLRQEKTLALPDADASAEWLIKQAQERDIDILRASLIEDIHKFSMTPDFSDEKFSGNASGIAIKYKLFNFDNRIKLKERYFIDGLRERARAFCGWLATRQNVALDADELVFKLTRRLPVNESERAQALKNLQDILPIETLVYNSPLQADPASGGGSDA